MAYEDMLKSPHGSAKALLPIFVSVPTRPTTQIRLLPVPSCGSSRLWTFVPAGAAYAAASSDFLDPRLEPLLVPDLAPRLEVFGSSADLAATGSAAGASDFGSSI